MLTIFTLQLQHWRRVVQSCFLISPRRHASICARVESKTYKTQLNASANRLCYM